MATKTLLYGDLTLPTAIWSAGAFTHGVVRSSGLHVAATYTQTAQPTDPSVGSPILIDWNPTLNNTSAPYGPVSATGLYGPRALINIEGTTQVGANQSIFAFTPIGFGDMHRVKNVVGSNRNIVPGWVIMSARTTYADTNTVTIKGNDIADGTASFVDAQTFMTANSGTLDGTSDPYEIITVLSMPFLLGNSHVSKRTAFKVLDMNQYLGTPGTDLSSNLSTYVVGADAGIGVVDAQYGIEIPHLTQATTNVGIQNASATVNVPWPLSVTAAGNTLPRGQTVLAVTPTSALTLTSAPTIVDGLDGETITIVNVGTNALTIQDAGTLTNSNLKLRGTTKTLNQYESITLTFNAGLSLWCQAAQSNPFRGPAVFDFGSSSIVNVRSLFGVPTVGLMAGSDTNDRLSLHLINENPTVAFSDGTATAASATTLARTGLDHLEMTFGTGDSVDFQPNSLGIRKSGDTLDRASFGVLPSTTLPAVSLGDGANIGNYGYLYRVATGQWLLSAASLQARFAPIVTSITSNATWSPNADTTSLFVVTAQAAAATTIANPSGTPVQGQRFGFRIKDDGTARALTWSGTQWRAPGNQALPTTTVIGQTLYLDFVYNSTDTKWDLVRADIYDKAALDALLALKAPLASPTFTGTVALAGATVTGLTAAEIPALAASAITSGVFGTARLGTGTANSGVFLRGDGTWVAVPGGGDMLAANNLSELTATQSTARTNIGAAPLASPAFTGTPSSVGGSLAITNTVDESNFNVTDGTAAHGKTNLSAGALGGSLNIYGNSGDAAANPRAALLVNQLQFGPGTGTPDIKIQRTGTTAMRIAEFSTNSLGFLGATPVTQQANTVDLGTVLSNFGFRVAGGNPALNLGSGALTAGTSTLGGTAVTGTITATSTITTSGGKIGYAAGTGGTVSQATSRTTGVTLNKPCGTITLFSTTLAADTDVSFVFTNSQIIATDTIIFNVISGAAVKGGYHIDANGFGSGSCTITVRNHTPTITATEAPVIAFSILRAVTT